MNKEFKEEMKEKKETEILNDSENFNEVDEMKNISREKSVVSKLPEFRKLNIKFNNIDSTYSGIYNKYSRYFKKKMDEYLFNLNKFIWDLTVDELLKMIHQILPVDVDVQLMEVLSNDSDAFKVAKASCTDISTDRKIRDDKLICYNLIITGQSCNIGNVVIPIPINTEVKIDKVIRKNIYYVNRNKALQNSDKVLALEDLLAYLFINETAYTKFKELLELFENKYKFTYFITYKKTGSLTSEDCDMFSYKTPKSFGWHPSFGRIMVVEMFAWLNDEDEEKYLEIKYNRQLSEDYAKSYQDKKNPTEKILKKMKNNPFNNFFKKVEIDSDVDLDKFQQIEAEWINFSRSPLIKCLEVLKFKPDLRFRKLGQHKATGLYYPGAINCICVDIRDISSFVHELGHCLDCTLTDKRLSSDFKFKEVIVTYKYHMNFEVDSLRESEKNRINRKKSYFFQATEIFARSFEQYLIYEKNFKSSFLSKDFNLNGGYIGYDKMKTVITAYFDSLFKEYNIIIPNDFSTLIIEKNIEFNMMDNKEIKINLKEKSLKENLTKENINPSGFVKENIENKENSIEKISIESEIVLDNTQINTDADNISIKDDINKASSKTIEEPKIILSVYSDRKHINQLTLLNLI